MKNYSDAMHVNVGSGEDMSILELTQMVCDVVGFPGKIEHDLSKPDGTPRKLMDVGKLAALGWTARTPLREGLAASYRWFLDNERTHRAA
jgi:GDP-L-fucose synthase